MKRRKVAHPLVIGLVKARHDQGLTQMQVADRLGFVPGAVGNWEAGYQLPRVDNLTAWADSLGYEVALVKKKEAPKC